MKARRGCNGQLLLINRSLCSADLGTASLYQYKFRHSEQSSNANIFLPAIQRSVISSKSLTYSLAVRWQLMKIKGRFLVLYNFVNSSRKNIAEYGNERPNWTARHKKMPILLPFFLRSLMICVLFISSWVTHRRHTGWNFETNYTEEKICFQRLKMANANFCHSRDWNLENVWIKKKKAQT